MIISFINIDVLKKLLIGLITNNTIRKIEIKQQRQIFFVDENSISTAIIVNIFYINIIYIFL
jgi:hypothetical protein